MNFPLNENSINRYKIDKMLSMLTYVIKRVVKSCTKAELDDNIKFVEYILTNVNLKDTDKRQCETILDVLSSMKIVISHIEKLQTQEQQST